MTDKVELSFNCGSCATRGDGYTNTTVANGAGNVADTKIDNVNK